MLRNINIHSSSSNNLSSSRRNWGPLLITIAPLCSGKSSLLLSLQEEIVMVSPQNEPNVYTRLAANTMIQYSPESEMKLITLLFNKTIGIAEFRQRLSDITEDIILREELISAATQLLSTGKFNLETKDVYMYEQLSAGVATISALKLLKKSLKKSNAVVCWDSSSFDGTNFQASLQQVLAMAAKYERIVRFVRWSYEIPIITFRELLKRNIIRFLYSGHYWPSRHILSSFRYAEKLIHLGEWTAEPLSSSLRMSHTILAHYFNYQMDQLGFVSPLSDNTTSNDLSTSTVSNNTTTNIMNATSNDILQPILAPSGQGLNPLKRRSFRALFTSSTQTLLQPLNPSTFTNNNASNSSNFNRDEIRRQFLESYPWAEWLGDNSSIHRLQRGILSGNENDSLENDNQNAHWRALYGLSGDSASYDLAELHTLSQSIHHDNDDEEEHKLDSLSMLVSPSSEPEIILEDNQKIRIDSSQASSPFPFLDISHKSEQKSPETITENTKTNVTSTAAALYLQRSQAISNAKLQLEAIDQLYSPTNSAFNSRTHEQVVNSLHVSSNSSTTTELDAGQLQYQSSASSTTTTTSNALLNTADPTLTNTILHFHEDASSRHSMQKPLLRLEHPVNDASAEGERSQPPPFHPSSCFRRLFCCGI